MKILHIVPSYKPAFIYGGPIESIARLCEGLVTAGHDVHVYTTTANGKQELDVKPGLPVFVDNVLVTYFNRITKDPTHVSTDLWKHLYKTVNEYDVVHIHSWWNILVMGAAKICLIKGAKVIVAPRGMLSTYIFNSGSSIVKKILHRIFGKSILSKTSFHATSKAEFVECANLINGWNGFIAPNILTLPDIPILRRKNQVFTLIFLSRIHPKKGIEKLFYAIKELQHEVILKIAGSGEESYIADLKTLAADLEIESKIQWVGWKNREEKFLELMNADLFVLASLNENFANVVVESLHMGTPVLVSSDVALSDFVVKNDVGWVTSLDISDIASNLDAAMKDIEKRSKINQSGRQIIEENFSEHKLIAQYIRNYKNL